MEDYLMVEYSPIQKAFHKHPTSQMIKSNHRTIFNRKNLGYIPVGVFETHGQADNWIYYNRHHFDKLSDGSESDGNEPNLDSGV